MSYEPERHFPNIHYGVVCNTNIIKPYAERDRDGNKKRNTDAINQFSHFIHLLIFRVVSDGWRSLPAVLQRQFFHKNA